MRYNSDVLYKKEFYLFGPSFLVPPFWSLFFWTSLSRFVSRFKKKKFGHVLFRVFDTRKGRTPIETPFFLPDYNHLPSRDDKSDDDSIDER